MNPQLNVLKLCQIGSLICWYQFLIDVEINLQMITVYTGNVTVGEFPPGQMFQTDDLWFELVMDEEETQKNGIAFIIDMAGISWKFMRYFTPTIVTVSTRKAEVCN